MPKDRPPMSKEIRLLSTSAILGYGFPEASLKAGLDRDPHFIGVDGGSVDPGPHYLGSGKPFCSAARDPPRPAVDVARGDRKENPDGDRHLWRCRR